jgi:hypothetical protein
MSATITSGARQWLAQNATKAPHGNASASPSERARTTSANLRDATITPVNLGYDPFPKQQQFHASPAKYRLFGGAAGPGKSKALLMEAILQAHEIPGANTLLLRRTFSELEQSLLLYFRRDVPRELYKSYNDSKHVVTWHNNSTTRFGYCQSENDVYQYQGAEFLFIGIDELTLFTLRQWQFLTSRNRCPVPGAFPCMAAATNPGNIGHAWVKALWIDKQPAPGMENPGEYDPADYDFIPARVTDNPIYAADENYLKTLRALPSHLKRAFLDGDWDVFAGQYFDKFDFTRHVIRPELIDWKPWWPRWISIDWGFEHYAATYWHAALPATSVEGQGFSPDINGRAEHDTPVEGRDFSPATNGRAQRASSGGRSFSSDITDRREAPPSVEGQGFSPDTNDRAKRASSLGGRSFSSDITDVREAPSSLPKAVAEGASPQRHASDAVTSAPNPAAPPSSPVGAQHAVPGANTWRDVPHQPAARGDAVDVAASTASNITAADAPSSRHPERSAPVSSSVFAASANTPAHAVEGPLLDPAATSALNPAAAIAEANRAREESSAKLPRRPRTWLGFAGTIPGTPPDAPASGAASRTNENSRCVISYREYVTHRTAPRELAREIVRRSVQSTPSPVGARYTVPATRAGRRPRCQRKHRLRASRKNRGRGNRCGVRELAPAVCRPGSPGRAATLRSRRRRGRPRRIAGRSRLQP